MIDKALVDVLACPKCRGSVHLSDDNELIVCEKCEFAYQIDKDIPVMLIDNAIKYEKK